MQGFLQLWGGMFYLLQKIGLCAAERCRAQKKFRGERRWRIAAWSGVLVGLPAWLAIFAIERNWIVGAVELSNAPGMFLGLLIAIRGMGNEPQSLRWFALIAIAVGITASCYDLGGFHSATQTLELGTVVGFLIGTYLLAHKRPAGYLWFLGMNASMGTLMAIQGYPWLVAQQVISLAFAAAAFLFAIIRREPEPAAPQIDHATNPRIT